MAYDPDLIRRLLLLIDEKGVGPDTAIENFSVEGYDERHVSNHVWLLKDGGLIIADEGVPDMDDSGYFYYTPHFLTNQGAQLLASVRDPDVWSKTKEIMQAVGTGSIKMMTDIATGLASAKLATMFVS